MSLQETGTQILARARIIAQDNDSASNFSVNAANALIILNDILMTLSTHFKGQPKWLGASTTGLSFSAGDVSVITSATCPSLNEFESFHPSNSSSLTYPIAPALERVSVQQMLEMLGYDGDNALAQTAADWTHVAAERAQSDTAANGVEKWRVWAYPVINRTRHLTVRAPLPVTISAITDYPDLNVVDSRTVSRLLAYEIAKLNKESSADFLEGILSPVPRGVRQLMYGGNLTASQLQDHVIQRND